MSLRDCALRQFKKTLNKTFKELQNEYPHDISSGGGVSENAFILPRGGRPIAVRMRTRGEGGSKKAKKLRS